MSSIGLVFFHRMCVVSIDMTPYRSIFFLLIFTFVAAIPRFYGLSITPVETDEHTGLMMKDLSVVKVWRQVVGFDSHPPLFYLVLKTSFGLIPDPVLAMRIPSAIAGTLAVPTVWFLTRRPLGIRGAWISAFVIAFNPLHIGASQNGRMYAMLSLFAALAGALLLESIARHNNRWYRMALIIVLTAGLYTHYVFWTIPATMLIWLLFRLNNADPAGHSYGRLKASLGAVLVACATFVLWPVMIFVSSIDTALSGRIGIFFDFSPIGVAINTSRLIHGPVEISHPAAILVFLMLTVLMWFTLKGSGQTSLFVILLFVAPLLLHLLATLPLFLIYDSTVFYFRYMTALLPGLAALIAACFVFPRFPAKLYFIPILLIIAQFHGMAMYFTNEVQPYMHQAIGLIQQHGKTGDLVLLSGVLSKNYWECYDQSDRFAVFAPGYWNPLHTFVSPGDYKARALADEDLIAAMEQQFLDLSYQLNQMGIWNFSRIWLVEEAGLDPYDSPRDRMMREKLANKLSYPELEEHFEKAGVTITLWKNPDMH